MSTLALILLCAATVGIIVAACVAVIEVERMVADALALPERWRRWREQTRRAA